MAIVAQLLPDERVRSIYELDLEGLERRGIRGLIFDLDNTLGPWGFQRWDEHVLRWLDAVVAQGFRLGFLSNDGGEGRDALLERLDGHPVLFEAGKPRRRGYRRVLTQLGLPPERAAMVGDQLFTDVWGAKRLGMYTVLVDPFDLSRETRSARMRRWLERQVLRWGPRP